MAGSDGVFPGIAAKETIYGNVKRVYILVNLSGMCCSWTETEGKGGGEAVEECIQLLSVEGYWVAIQNFNCYKIDIKQIISVWLGRQNRQPLVAIQQMEMKTGKGTFYFNIVVA